jgi:preprotein translocase subunit SecG
MIGFVIALQVVVALFLILVVLLQPGNRGGVSAAFGGAGGDTVFGARGANTFLAKLTFGAAVLFMVCNLILSFMSTPRSAVASVVKDVPAAEVVDKKDGLEGKANEAGAGVETGAPSEKAPAEAAPAPAANP